MDFIDSYPQAFVRVAHECAPQARPGAQLPRQPQDPGLRRSGRLVGALVTTDNLDDRPGAPLAYLEKIEITELGRNARPTQALNGRTFTAY